MQAFARIGEHSVFSLVTSTSIVQICFATPPTQRRVGSAFNLRITYFIKEVFFRFNLASGLVCLAEFLTCVVPQLNLPNGLRIRVR